MSLVLRSVIAVTAILTVLLSLAAGSLYLSEEEITPESATIAYNEHFPNSEEMVVRMAAELEMINAENLAGIETAAGGE